MTELSSSGIHMTRGDDWNLLHMNVWNMEFLRTYVVDITTFPLVAGSDIYETWSAIVGKD